MFLESLPYHSPGRRNLINSLICPNLLELTAPSKVSCFRQIEVWPVTCSRSSETDQWASSSRYWERGIPRDWVSPWNGAGACALWQEYNEGRGNWMRGERRTHEEWKTNMLIFHSLDPVLCSSAILPVLCRFSINPLQHMLFLLAHPSVQFLFVAVTWFFSFRESHFAYCQTLGREHDTDLTHQNILFLRHTVIGSWKRTW